MSPDPLLTLLPLLKLRPSKDYGHPLACGFAGLALTLLALQYVRLSPITSGLASLLVAAAVYWSAGKLASKTGAAGHTAHLTSPSGLNNPPMTSKLVAWTRLGGVIELVFDTGTWVLVRSDVNDAQWRDVQMMLLWRKRVPSRVAL
jgi:hypothetical protein